MHFSKTLIDEWKQSTRNPGLRVGQHFFNYFSCHKVTSKPARSMLDKIYELDGSEAFRAIEMLTDYTS